MKNTLMAILLTTFVSFSAATQAAYLTEAYAQDNSFITAQFIDDIYFDNKYDRDINTESGSNISLTTRHASILGSGDNSIDFYSFNGLSGRAYFDIDYAGNFGGVFDSWLELYDSSFKRLAFDDDSLIESGSFSGLDSFISYNLTTNDLYFIAIGRFPSMTEIPFGANYTLHVSQRITTVPLPAATWLFISGVLSLSGFATRHSI